MLIRKHATMNGSEVTMPGASDVQMRMLLGRDDGAPNFAMRHFTVAPGGHTPKHQHDYEHGIYIVAGKGTIEIDGQTQTITPGDSLFVQPNTPHQFRADQNAPLEFLCMVPTTFDCGKPTPGS